MSRKTRDAAAPATNHAKSVRSPEGERLRKQALAEIEARVKGRTEDEDLPSPRPKKDAAKNATTTARTMPKPHRKASGKPPRSKARPPRLSALDAAAQVLAGSEKPMRAKDLIEQMAAKGLWKSPGGKTPEATLYAAILREIQAKKSEARFKKVERGLFVHTPTSGKKGA